MSLSLRLAIAGLVLLAASGCAQMAPNYNPSVENIQKLRDTGAGKVRVAVLEPKLVEGQKNDTIQLRGGVMTSPYGGKFTSYVEEALKSELQAAKLLDDKASVEIGGTVTRNDVSVGNMTTGYGELEARVVVRRAGAVRYDKVKSARTTFETGFLGATAIANGIAAYPELVRTFLGVVYADPEFIAALK
ncbi:MAG: hypothetical protein JSS40_15975 [Proteobacteria bacterium]|nr:hypothetical protein [Pseudomonadota bacterium]